MSVYVDPSRWPYGRMVMCHMWADTEDELMVMADKIGVARKWVQRPPQASWLHFDISKAKRLVAVSFGAVETDQYGPLEWQAKQWVLSGDAGLMQLAENRLQQITKCRNVRKADNGPTLL